MGDDALALYAGDLMTGFFLNDAPEFEQWLGLRWITYFEIDIVLEARAARPDDCRMSGFTK